MENFTKSLKTKAFKLGAYSTLSVMVALAVLIVINLVAQQLDIRYDLTKDKLYSISDDTKKILDELNQDVDIYPLFVTGNDDMVIDMSREIIDEYAAYSAHVRVTYKDPLLYPQFVTNIVKTDEAVPDGSVIVASGDRVKVIPVNDLISTEMNMQTYQQQLKSVDVEPQVSNAIVYVTQSNTPVVYSVTGHDEMPLPEQFKKELSSANYDMAELDLFNKDIPDDCGLLIVTMPSQDWTEEEAKKVMDYLAHDGRAMFLVSYLDEPLNNLNNVLSAYGVTLGGEFIVEGDIAHSMQENPYYLLPITAQNKAAQAIMQKAYKITTPLSQAVVELGLKKQTITIEPILVTSDKAYAKKISDVETVNKGPEDTEGPFNIAVAITDEQYTTEMHYTKIVVIGDAFMLDETTNAYVGGGNFQFLISAANWTQDKQSAVYIAPKMTSTQPLQLSGLNVLLLAAISVLVLPALIIGTGFVIWLKRRNS